MSEKFDRNGSITDGQAWQRALTPDEVSLLYQKKPVGNIEPSLFAIDRQHPISDGLCITTPSGKCRVNRVRSYDRLMQIECYAYGRWLQAYSPMWHSLTAACTNAVRRNAEYKGVR